MSILQPLQHLHLQPLTGIQSLSLDTNYYTQKEEEEQKKKAAAPPFPKEKPTQILHCTKLTVFSRISGTDNVWNLF
jgi:hypothetical protein